MLTNANWHPSPSEDNYSFALGWNRTSNTLTGSIGIYRTQKSGFLHEVEVTFEVSKIQILLRMSINDLVFLLRGNALYPCLLNQDGRLN